MHVFFITHIFHKLLEEPLLCVDFKIFFAKINLSFNCIFLHKFLKHPWVYMWQRWKDHIWLKLLPEILNAQLFQYILCKCFKHLILISHQHLLRLCLLPTVMWEQAWRMKGLRVSQVLEQTRGHTGRKHPISVGPKETPSYPCAVQHGWVIRVFYHQTFWKEFL